MFKRFIPIISHSSSTINKGETIFDVDACSSKSSPSKSGSSEQINRSDIPTLRRRHSFVTPYAESLLEEEINKNNDNADLSIDPFDSINTLKRSKSLSFNITRQPSFSTLRKRTPKSVHFEAFQDQAENKRDFLESKYGNSNEESSILEKETESPEKKPSFDHDSTGRRKKFDQVDHTSMEIYRSQENEIQRKYSLFLDDSIVPEPDKKSGQKDILEAIEESKKESEETADAILPDQMNELSSRSKKDNKFPFTEHSQEEYYVNCIDNKHRLKQKLEYPVEEDRKYIDENLLMKKIFQNIYNIENHELGKMDNSNLSLEKLLDISEKIRGSLNQKDLALSSLKNQLQKYESEELEKNSIKEKCKSLQLDLNSCKIENNQLSKKFGKLVQLESELEEKLKTSNRVIDELEVKLSNSSLHLQAELDSRKDLFALINKYDDSEEISDKYENLKDYIEQLFMKNETIIKENAHILEQKMGMKNEIETLRESLKSSLDRTLETQETLELVTEENETLKSNMKELNVKLSNKITCFTDKISVINKVMEEKDEKLSQLQFSITELEGSIVLLKEEKENLQRKLADNLIDIEEANKQIKEELEYRNQMERDYNDLDAKTKEAMREFEIEIKNENEQLKFKECQVSELEDRNSELKKQLDVLKEEQKISIAEKMCYLKENQKLTKANTDSKLVLNLLEEHIEKSSKNLDIMSKEYLLVLKSNDIVTNCLKKFIKNSFQCLQPIMYDESREYFTKLYKEIGRQALFAKDQEGVLGVISNFTTQCISDVVSQYLEKEILLESEVENRNNNYQRMLEKLTKIMEDSIFRAVDSKENISGSRVTRKIEHKTKSGVDNRKQGIIYKNPNQ